MYLLWLVIRCVSRWRTGLDSLKTEFYLCFRVLLLGPTALAVVTTQADERDNPHNQDGEEIVEDEVDDVTENEVDEE